MNSDFRNQIFRLSPAEIDAIQDDIRLRAQGYTFFYAVDTYDFVNFFAPYLNKLNFEQQRLNFLAQEAICYESFFTSNSGNSIILLDEYKKELFQVKDLFFEKVKHAVELTENKLELVREILALIESGASLPVVIARNFELFMLSLIFSKRQTSITGTSFLKFLDIKMHVEYFETATPEFDEFAIGAFKKEADKPSAATVYDAFVERSAGRLKGLNEEKLYKYLENTYHDIEAIERLLSANQAVSKSKVFNKNIFYYFSSTPFKSKLIFDIFDSRFKDHFSFRNIFPHSQTDILRNNFQVFLLSVLQNEYPDSVAQALNVLEKLKEVKQYQRNPGQDYFIPDGINQLLDKYTSLIENHFYKSLLSNYKETLRSILSDKVKKNEELQVMLQFNEYLEKQKQDAYVQDLAYDINKLGQIALLKNALAFRVIKVAAIKVNFGIDIIKFNYHHLPFLPFLFSQELHEKYNALYLFLQYISDIEDESDNSDKAVLDYLGQLGESDSNSFKERSFDFLILTYIDLLAASGSPSPEKPADPAEETKEKKEGMEMILIQALERRLRVAEKAEQIRKKKAPRKHKDQTTSIFKEISYILIWLYRRNLLFNKVSILEEKWKLLDLHDARFQHGVGLAAISEFYDSARPSVEIKYLVEKSISSLFLALSGYKKIHPKIHSDVVSWLLQKNIIAAYNSICDAQLVLYDIEKLPAHLEKCRKSLASMKEYMQGEPAFLDNLPVPNMTEAQLETYESQIAFDRGDIFIAKKKLDYAKKRYEKAIEKKSVMDSQFGEKVLNKITELNRKIGIEVH